MNINDGPTYSIIWLIPIWAVTVAVFVCLAIRSLKKDANGRFTRQVQAARSPRLGAAIHRRVDSPNSTSEVDPPSKREAREA